MSGLPASQILHKLPVCDLQDRKILLDEKVKGVSIQAGPTGGLFFFITLHTVCTVECL